MERRREGERRQRNRDKYRETDIETDTERQRDTVGKSLPLYMADLGLLLGTTYGSSSTGRSEF